MTITRAAAQTNADTIKNEVAPGANTASRVGQLFRDLADSVAFTADLAAAIAAGITEAAVRTALAALTAAPDFNAKKISNVADPAAAQDVATKTSSEAVVTAARVLTALAAAAASVAVNAQKITGLANGTVATDAVALGQITGASREWCGTTTFGNSAGGNRFLNNNTSATAGGVASSTETQPNQHVAGRAGKLTRLVIVLDVAAVTADAVFTVRINGVDTALTASLAHGTLAAVGTGSVTVAETDLLTVKIVATAGDATATNPRAVVVITPV